MNTEIINNKDVETIRNEHAHHADLKLFGFWVYLMSDLVIFSVLFATFVVLGRNYAGGEGPKELFELPYLFIETMLLLLSSISYGFSIVAMNSGNKKMVVTGLIITALLGLGFISMEMNEFYKMIMEGNSPSKSAFLSSFFTLVGTHGTHVVFGLLWIVVMIIQIIRNGLSMGVKTRLMMLSLFWHFLDVVWVGVFTVVYLLGLV